MKKNLLRCNLIMSTFLFLIVGISNSLAGDISGNVRDQSGFGIQNVRVELVRNNTFVEAVYTNANGFYEFTDLPAGEWLIFNQGKFGWTRISEVEGDVGNDNITHGITNYLSSNEINEGNDFVMSKSGARISGKVFDQSTNIGIGNVVVQLRNWNGGALVAETTTKLVDQNPDLVGTYQFNNIANGEYFTYLVFPPGYVRDGKNSGGNDSDSPTNGTEAQDEIYVRLTTGETDGGNDYFISEIDNSVDCNSNQSEAKFEWSPAPGQGNEWATSNDQAVNVENYTVSYKDNLNQKKTIDVNVTLNDPDNTNMHDGFTCPPGVQNCEEYYRTGTNEGYGSNFFTLYQATSNADQEVIMEFEFSRAVYLKNFTIGDIDWQSLNAANASGNGWTSTSYQDEVKVIAERDLGSVVLSGTDLVITEGSRLTREELTVDGGTHYVFRDDNYGYDNNGYGLDGNEAPSDPANSIMISSTGKITKLTVIYSNGPADVEANIPRSNGVSDPGRSNSHAIRISGFTFCTDPIAAIKGQVLVDTNGNDLGEAGLGGVDLQLWYDDGFPVRDTNGDIVTVQTSTIVEDVDGDGVYDPIGTYYFKDLLDGAYIVKQIQPTEYASVREGDFSDDGDAADGTFNNNNEIAVYLDEGEIDYNNDFIERRGIITGNVKVDTDGDDLGNDPLENVTLTLTDTSGNVVQYDDDNDPDTPNVDYVVTTDANGDYSFGNLPDGDYIVVQTQPNDYISVADGDYSQDGDANDLVINNDNSIPVTITDAETDADNNFVEKSNSGSISGNVSADTTGNGLGDTPLPNITLTLADENGTPLTYDNDNDPNTPEVPITTTTNQDGDYVFQNVPDGNYIVLQKQPVDYISLSEVDGGDDSDNPDNGITNSIPVTVAVGEQDSGNNFVETQLGSISGSVLEDTNNDGAGESPINAVEITIKNTDGSTLVYDHDNDPSTNPKPAVTTTDSNGEYNFPNIPPGEYVIVETQPANYDSVLDQDSSEDNDTTSNDDQFDNSIPVTVIPNENDTDNIFVEIQYRDYGDLPKDYPDVSAIQSADANNDNVPDAADAVYGGNTVSYESNSLASVDATGDTLGDDGLTIKTKAPKTGTNRTETWEVAVNANTAGTEVFYQVNIDWDNDGIFDDVFTGSQSVTTAGTPETQELTINVPDSYTDGPVNVRYVVATNANDAANASGSNTATSFVNGEVEDYQFTKTQVLPVVLVNFNGVQKNNNVLLSWATSSENNNDKFVLEYSFDGVNFNFLTEVNGNGTTTQVSNYSYIHENIMSSGANTVYYLLKQVDFDRTEEYLSNVVTVALDGSNNKFVVYPNPAKVGQAVTILGTKDFGSYEVYNTSGQVVLKNSSSLNRTTINTNTLAKGNYFVKFENGKTAKFIVE